VSFSTAQHVRVERAPASQEPASSVEETGDPSVWTVGEIEAESEPRRGYLLHRFWRDARGYWGREAEGRLGRSRGLHF
jgi:hypothetical protein